MKAHISMIYYDKWANDRTLDYLRQTADLHPDVLQRFFHILDAQKTWIDRIKSRSPEHAPANRTLDEAADELQRCYDELMEFFSWIEEHELDTPIQYSDSKQNTWWNTPREIITHLCNHGTYHRGQIALLVRTAGGVPVATDYIVMIREQNGKPQQEA